MQCWCAGDDKMLWIVQVLFDTGIFASTGQVRLHRGSQHDLHAAKKLFEDFFRVMEDMSAKDEEV